MNTKISAYADRLIEAGWLIAAIAVPVFFNVYSSRTFEPDKLTLLRSIALVMAAAWLVKLVDTGWQRPPGETWGQTLRRLVTGTPLVVPTLLLILAYLLATVFSIAPRLSIFGSYQRLQGTYTTLSYIVIFFLLLQGLRQREQIERLITTIIITSIPVTLYGVLQNLGFDPLPWLGDVQRRIASTMGNSIFVAAYLIMVVPLTLGRLLRTVTATLDLEDPPTANFVLIPFYVLILISQLVAIVFTQSRGPQFGLLGGVFFFVLLALFELRRRRPGLAVTGVLTWVGLAFGVFFFILVFNLPNSPLAGLRNAPYIGRLGRVLVDNPTGDVRVLIWRGAEELVTSDPVRFLIGYGPETMHVAYNPFYPPDLAHIESRNASPDRSHNETWDALVTTGAIGFITYLALFTSVFYLGLRWLGLITTPRQRNLFFGLWFGGGIAAAATAVALTEPGYFGVAFPFGMMAGLFLYLVGYALILARRIRQGLPTDDTASATPYRFLLVALYAALIAHFIEIHFGIAIAATRTYFWMYAALLVAAGYLWQTRPGLAEPSSIESGGQAVKELALPARDTGGRGRKANGGRISTRSARSAGVAPRPSLFARDLLVQSLLVGVLLVVMVFDFYAPAAGIGFNWHMGWLFTFSWVFATPIVLAERTQPPRDGAGWFKTLGLYAAVSLGWTLLYLGVHAIMFASPTAESIAWAPVGIYLYLAVSMAALAALLLRGEALPKTWIADARAIVYPFLALFIAAVIFATNMRVVSADILYKQAWVNYHQRQQYDPALKLYNDALSEQPSQDFYLLFKGKALLEKAQSTGDAAQREATFREAEQVLKQAQALNPLNTDHTANLARMYQTWASYAANAQERDQRLQKSLEYYEESARLSPNNALIYNQWASAYMDAQQPDKALEMLDKSLALDSTFSDTYMRLIDVYAALGQMDKVQDAYQKAVKLTPKSADPHMVLGDAYRARQDWPKAVDAYRTAVQTDPRSASAHSALALALAQTGQRDAAIQENLEVLKLAPTDISTLRNLALLYRDAGRLNDSLAYARKALERDPKNTALSDFVKQLEAQGAK